MQLTGDDEAPPRAFEGALLLAESRLRQVAPLSWSVEMWVLDVSTTKAKQTQIVGMVCYSLE